METIEKKKRGRPKGSTKINKNKPPESNHPLQQNKVPVINSKASIEDQRANIQNWLNGSQNYTEGLELLRKCTKRFGVYLKLFRKESERNRQRLVHELSAYLLRTKPRVYQKEIQTKELDKPEDIAAMENLSIPEKIQKWMDGPRDYFMGRKLLAIVPGQHLHYLQLHHIETLGSKVRLGVWLKGALEYIRDGVE